MATVMRLEPISCSIPIRASSRFARRGVNPRLFGNSANPLESDCPRNCPAQQEARRSTTKRRIMVWTEREKQQQLCEERKDFIHEMHRSLKIHEELGICGGPECRALSSSSPGNSRS